jgi:hypothetical protein
MAYGANVLLLSVVVQRDEASADVLVNCPKFTIFVHRCFIETARYLMDTHAILDPGIPAATKMSAMSILDERIAKAIGSALSMMMPMDVMSPPKPEDEKQYEQMTRGLGDLLEDEDEEENDPSSMLEDATGLGAHISADEDDEDEEDDDEEEGEFSGDEGEEDFSEGEEDDFSGSEDEDSEEEDSEDFDDDDESDKSESEGEAPPPSRSSRRKSKSKKKAKRSSRKVSAPADNDSLAFV